MARTSAAVLAGVAAAWAAPSIANLVLRSGHRWARRTIADESAIALTFDDGPQPSATPEMLNLLDRLDVRATFFVVGDHARQYPQIVREMVARGHSVQCHGRQHTNHLLRNPLQIEDDMRSAADIIEGIAGSRPHLFRPPQGVVTWPTITAAQRHFSDLVLWSKWGRDWRRAATVDTIVDEVSTGLRGGDILLLHDADWYGSGSFHRTLAATERVVLCAQSQGLSLTTLEGEFT